MTESHDPMCSVPLSYLTMLQGRQGGHTVEYRPDSAFYLDKAKPMDQALDELNDKLLVKERDDAYARIAEFEERAGCRLEHIPVEALNAAQDYSVNQQAIDTLKKENEALQRQVNAHASEACDWRGKFKEAARERDGLLKAAGVVNEEVAPYGLKKDGTPKKRPGRKVPRKRAA